MEYIDVVGQIIDAEQRAKALAEAGAQRRAEMHSGLEQEETALREDCLTRVQGQVDRAREAAQTEAAREIARLDEEMQRARSQMEAAYEKNQARWVNTLFTMITGAEP